MKKYQLAVFQMLFAAIIWGLSFTMVRWGLQDFSTSQLLFWRFVAAVVISEIIFILFNRRTFKESNSDIKLSFKSGLALGATLLFQIHGLNYTTATKSAFITTTYVILLPFVSLLFFKHKIKAFELFFAGLALAGMALLIDIQNLNSTINTGDLITIFSAIAAAFHIIFIGKAANKCKSAFRFNTYQTLWSLVVIIPFFAYEAATKSITLWPTQVSAYSLTGLAALIFFVSIIAFFLQITSQKVLSTTTASMMCLLEAPFSFFFAAVLLNERLNVTQAVGALIILLSAMLSVYYESKQQLK